MKRFIMAIILISTLCAGLVARATAGDSIYSNAGTAGAQFLKIDAGARPTALGGSYCAVSDDTFGLFWNPAGVNRIRDAQYGFMYNAWFTGISQEVVSASFPFRSRDTISIGMIYLHMPKIMGTDIYGNETGNYTAYSLAAMASYSSDFYKFYEKNLDFGITAKYLSETIESESASAYCFDLGITGHTNNGKLLGGFAIQNLGGKSKFVSESFSLPRNIKLGAAYWVLEDKLLMLGDINKTVDEAMRYGFGGEFMPYYVTFSSVATTKFDKPWKNVAHDILTTLKLRGGWNSRGTLTAGFGIRFRSIYNLDYAFVPYTNLGATHRVSLTIKFDAPRQKKPPKPKKIKRKSREEGETEYMYAEDRVRSIDEVGTIYGMVTDHKDQPVQNASIKISNMKRKEIMRLYSEHDGSYRVDELPGGKYIVKVWKKQWDPDVKEIEITEDPLEVDFQITPYRKTNYIYGMVVDQEGKPITNAVIKITQKGVEIARLTTDFDGKYKTEDLLYGKYEIKAWLAAGDKSKTRRCKVKKGRPTRINFTLKK